MKLWFSNKKSEKTQKPETKPVGQELSDELMAQITGGKAADMSNCHV